MVRNRKFAVGLIFIIFLAVGLGLGIYMALKPRSPIPGNIHKQLTFQPYIVKDSSLKVEDKTYKYDAPQKTFSYVVSGAGFGKLTISQQATPQSFIDIPDLYEKLVDSLNRYGAFQNQFGTVYLTKPDGQKSGQTAVVNSSGVLMFIRSEKDLSDDQWRSIFTRISLEKS
ncbi:MAG TPA: hypothetical protein VFK11_04855 [Candidatus Saccharimonadales bacterium]|nr:hypothetical protein [Candidatus Saccharimonadales bacterium]